MMLLTRFLLLLLPSPILAWNKPTNFSSVDAKPAGNLIGLSFVSRYMAPYGPPLHEDYVPGELLKGYAFAAGAIEGIAYDEINKFMYTVSASDKHGFVVIADYKDPTRPALTNLVLDNRETGAITDATVCSQQGWLFLTNFDNNTIDMYSAVQRSNPTQPPKFLRSIPVSLNPAKALPNADCSILAVVNRDKGDILMGEVSLIRNLDTDTPTVTRIPLDSGAWNDDYILRKGLHMPLTKNAMKYWTTLNPELNFTQELANYRSSFFVTGESLAWTPDQSELLVNLQINNGLLRIDVAKNEPADLAGYGLKDHAEVAVDINRNDMECNLLTYENLFSMRNPDTIGTFQYNGKSYVLTANEGDSREFKGYEDSMAMEDLFVNQTFGLTNMSVWPSVFDPAKPLGGPNAASFNTGCVGIHCVGNVKVSLGSSAIDYEVDPTNPVLERMVLFGGRGWTIYELPENPSALLKLVYDSGDSIERQICVQLPFAHNSVQDDDYAPVANFPNNTRWEEGDEDLREILWELSDPEQEGCANQGDGTPGACPYSQTMDRRSHKDGPSVEMIISGVACGRLMSLITTEKSSVAFLYDMTDITDPTLLQIFHLSPASVDQSPGLAYNQGTIGEIDPEAAFFLSDKDSPSGKAGMFIVGTHSGTVSFWEFECADQEPQAS